MFIRAVASLARLLALCGVLPAVGPCRTPLTPLAVQELACRNPTAEAKLEAMRKAENDQIYASTGKWDGSRIDPSTGCDVRRIAKGVPECFDYELWDTGWVCELMQEVFRKVGAKIVVKTQANNTVSELEYSGPSAYTRSACMRLAFPLAPRGAAGRGRGHGGYAGSTRGRGRARQHSQTDIAAPGLLRSGLW